MANNNVTLLLLFNSFAMCFCKMNVLFLAADDLRPQLGCYYGSDFPSPVHPPMYTPNLDKLASRSLLLKRSYVQQAVCSPSRTSLLTGRRPDTTHVYDLQHYFRNVGGNFTTIPQHFKNEGYSSIGMGKIFHPGKASGHDDPISWSEPYFHGKDYWDTREYSWRAIPDKQLKYKPLIDEQVADHAVATLQRLAPSAKSGDNPFFLAVGFHKPHLPFVFPESMLEHYPESSIQLPDNAYAPVNMPHEAWTVYSELRKYKDISQLHATGHINTTLPDNVVKALRRAYYSAVSWTDSLVGRVVKQLDDLGLSDNTVISFWGDHGWQLGEHGEWCKHTNFELATHAPMMVRIPGKTDNGIVTEQLTEFVDLFPTLVDAVGLTSLKRCPENSSSVDLCSEGTSMLPLIKSPRSPIKNASFSQYPRSEHGVKDVMGYSIRTDTVRYTEWVYFKEGPPYKPDWNTLYGVELYDHSNDAEENHNVANDPRYAARRVELSRQLRKGWRGAVVPPRKKRISVLKAVFNYLCSFIFTPMFFLKDV